MAAGKTAKKAACKKAPSKKPAPEKAVGVGEEEDPHSKAVGPPGVVDKDLWKYFMADKQVTADCLPPVNETLDMASAKSSNSKSAPDHFSVDDQIEAVRLLATYFQSSFR